MVLLYIEGKVGDFTVYLEQPIEKPWFITLRRCTFYNRWKNLSSEGTVSDGERIILRIPAGHYTLETLKRQIDGALYIGKKPVSIDKSSQEDSVPSSGVRIKAHQNVVLSDSLADLLGLKNKRLKAETQHEIQLKTLDVIFIHCDLVNASGVLKQVSGAVQVKPSQILACVEVGDVKGKITFSPHSPIQLSTTSVDYVSSLRLSVKDSEGNTIKSNLYPMRLVLEIV